MKIIIELEHSISIEKALDINKEIADMVNTKYKDMVESVEAFV